jgi:hypothetical protein
MRSEGRAANRPRFASALTLAGVGLSVAASTSGGNPAATSIAIISGALAAAGAVAQYRCTQPHVIRVSKADWTAVEETYELHVPNRAHGNAGGASVPTLMWHQDRLVMAMCAIEVTDQGGVIVRCNRPFDGELRIV